MSALIAVFLAAAAAGAPPPATPMSFVQATIVAPDTASRTLGFVDASGRTRSHRVSADVAPRLGRLRPGDEVIVVLTGTDPVVQDVRVSHAAAPTPVEAMAREDAGPQWTVVPAGQMRPSWPNPYSRFYRGPRPRRGGAGR